MPDEPKNETPALTTRERGERVLNSQGRAIGLWDVLPAEMQSRIAACAAPDGVVSREAVAVVSEVLTQYYDAQKAVVDEEPTPVEPPTPAEPAA